MDNLPGGSAPIPPGSPGIDPRWTSSAKSAVGTSLRSTSRVWYTCSHGILNEVYYPRIDHACVRDLGLLITDGRTFFSEAKSSVVVIDISGSIGPQSRALIGRTLRRLLDARNSFGLVFFSDTAYEAVPPGTRVRTTSIPSASSRAPRRPAWVLFPETSTPTKEIKH